MSKWLKVLLIVVGVLMIVLVAGFGYLTRDIALDTVYHPPEERPEIAQTPADVGLDYEEVTVTTADGYNLVGWYVPGDNGATVIAQHGSPGPMPDSLFEASILHAQGYNVLLSSFRAHGESDGEMITFGYHETKDIEAWYRYLLTREEVDPERIAIFGESMGGGTAILAAVENPELKAVAVASAFAMSQETIETFIGYEQPDLPGWLVPALARGIVFWV
ncbi:MAG: alpha/beta fold hydrolase, partial [Candidatus Promineifilaceae bacterium]|nr:alpha/beta fold hydrolase [Candidatus Promineifilaceae bacterium]